MANFSASRLSAVSLGALVAMLALAGVDLATSSKGGWVDLGQVIRGFGGDVAPTVNRLAKGDRGVLLPGSGETTILSFQPFGQANASVVMRFPAPTAAKPALGTGRPAASGARKPMIACEPMVSPLSAAARGLAPGRCVA
jgi:hypothetical protein